MLGSSLMALSDLTKQFAEQAIRNVTAKAAAPPPPPADNLGATILGQVQAMQRALKEDEELVVLLTAGGAVLRVLEFFLPSWQVAVVTGTDNDTPDPNDKSVTRVVSPVALLQLVCKVAKVPLPGKPGRIGFVAPKAKGE
jgi:hypothetical protein